MTGCRGWLLPDCLLAAAAVVFGSIMIGALLGSNTSLLSRTEAAHSSISRENLRALQLLYGAPEEFHDP
ncbi:hypothetical protein [Spirochaeta africana]|uniref:Uncharacterized protein n=1 Tax=Spirochaeta africana (strain ATCC 700263 / DSM 8902 / Z-7692) TaxID=889378 RepID=H9UK49_SPIAZ|nr:hypothetical protein [Spirochaeta africana]AFG37892.1 hypothetical protein Spiaf_1835 [Spirochaeta africana DSM 8902]